MSKALDASIEAAAKRRAHAMSPPSSPAEVASALAERKAAVREIEEKAAQAERLARVNEDLRVDIERLEQRIARFREVGKGRLERPQTVFEQKWGVMVEYEPLRSVKTGDAFADEEQANVTERKKLLADNEAEIKRLLSVEMD